MPRDAVSRIANVGTVGTNGLTTVVAQILLCNSELIYSVYINNNWVYMDGGSRAPPPSFFGPYLLRKFQNNRKKKMQVPSLPPFFTDFYAPLDMSE